MAKVLSLMNKKKDRQDDEKEPGNYPGWWNRQPH